MKKKAMERYDAARNAFLAEVKKLVSMCQQEARDSLGSREEHDYLMYLGANLAAMAEYVSHHDIATFERWKREFMGARRACDVLEDC